MNERLVRLLVSLHLQDLNRWEEERHRDRTRRMTIDRETVGIPEVLPEGSVGRATGLAFRSESRGKGRFHAFNFITPMSIFVTLLGNQYVQPARMYRKHEIENVCTNQIHLSNIHSCHSQLNLQLPSQWPAHPSPHAQPMLVSLRA